ncbi:unnamed protein product [Parnassius apollo]|uniref:Regulatory protein zeste n=1 Tax=Parnassius apollo TaxID=110799 RepID=A0A8S3Y634_PARAO|nr:unnamed protein product [Parnassius apollo]
MSDRKRSPHWQMSEKMLLVDLVAEHFSVVENKRTDAVTMKQKNAEWVKISEEFNSQTTFGYRTAENVKAQWESLKKSTKKESSAERQSLFQTGGGPSKPKLEDNPLYRKIFALISTTVVGLVNEYDSDNMSNNHFINEEIPSNTLASTKVPDVTDIFVAAPIYSMSMPLSMDIDTSGQNDDKPQAETDDWGDYTPKLLQTPKSAPLRAVSKREEDVGTSPTQNKEKNVDYFQDLEKNRNAQPSVSKLFSVAAKQDDDGLRA